MLQALAEIALAPDLVVGTSVGSINGALLAEDPQGAANRLSHLWLQVTPEMVFPGSAIERARTWRQHHNYVVESDGLRSVLSAALSTRLIENLTLPFAATATDVLTGRVVHLESGPLVPALLASSAVPGFYPPVQINGLELVDGGIVSNIPVDKALRMGAGSIVVLDSGLSALRTAAPRTLVQMGVQALAIMIGHQYARDLPDVARQVPVLHLPGPTPIMTSPLSFGAAAKLMQDAYRKTRAFLAEVKLNGPGVYGQPPQLDATILVADHDKLEGPGRGRGSAERERRESNPQPPT